MLTKKTSIISAVLLSATGLVAWGASTIRQPEHQPEGFEVPPIAVAEDDGSNAAEETAVADSSPIEAPEPPANDADTPATFNLPDIEPQQLATQPAPEFEIPAAAEPADAPATVAPAETAATPDNGIEGFTEPWADIELAASEMGTLAAIDVHEGDEVKVGQVIAQLDDDVLQASLKVAAAGMEAEGELSTAKTQLDLRTTELQKLNQLFERKHASHQEIDRIKGEVRIAESRIRTVAEDLTIRKLEHARIQAQIRQREIRSPIDGVIVDVKKDRGEFVSPSDPVVARIVQLDPLLVAFDVPTAERKLLKKHQRVVLSLGGADRKAIGQVEFISPIADASSGTFQVKVKLPNPNRRWLGGEKAVLLPHETPSATIAVNQK